MEKLTLIDYLILAFLVVSVIVGGRRGFARTAAGVVGVLLSVIGATICSGTLTQALTEALEPLMASTLQEQLAQYLPVGSDALSSGAAPVLLGTIQAVILKPAVFVIAFLLIQVIWLYACSYLSLLDRFPPIKKFNQLMGALLGLLKGVVILAVVLSILTRFGVITADQLHSSFLLGQATKVLGISL